MSILPILYTILVQIILGFAQTTQDFITSRHNKYRGLHHIQNFTPCNDNSVFDYAQNRANYMAATGDFSHNPGPYGENLSMCDPSLSDEDAFAAAIDTWYAENAIYDYNNPGFSPETGHFTQMVWAGTSCCACASATNANWKYICCTYDPLGNIDGQFSQNVLRP